MTACLKVKRRKGETEERIGRSKGKEEKRENQRNFIYNFTEEKLAQSVLAHFMMIQLYIITLLNDF